MRSIYTARCPALSPEISGIIEIRKAQELRKVVALIVQAFERSGTEIYPLRESFRNSLIVKDQLLILWYRDNKGIPRCVTCLK